MDMATFRRPVVGPISDDQQWLINPLRYDPTRPQPVNDQTGEIPDAERHSLATPTAEPATLGDHTRAASASDVDIAS